MNKTFFLFFLNILLFSCAEIVPPSGGEEDKTPPKVKTSSPENKSIFFDNNRIEIKFDEFIKFTNSSENIFITPSLTKKPTFKQIGKKLIVSFEEELLPNTTYSITFNESIEDYNEGNKIDVFNYTFSTGAYIDSLKIEGTLLNAFNKKPMDKTYILLYPENEDSILYKKPLYIAKTNSSGNYSLNFLKAGNYKIAALEDKNLNLLYDQKEELIAFSTEIINIKEDISLSPLFLFKNENTSYIEEFKQEKNNHAIFTFNKAIENIAIDISDYNDNNVKYISTDKQSFHYWYQNIDSSSSFYFNINNSFKDTLVKSLEIDSNSKLNIEVETYQSGETKYFDLLFSKPIINFNSDNFLLSDIKNNKIEYTYKWLDNNTKIQFKNINSSDSLKLKILKNCFTSFDNKSNDSIQKSLYEFKNYRSNLILNLPSNSSPLILQLINDKNKILEERDVSRETLVSFNNIKTGHYFIRIFKDDNNNGIWDNGLFHVKQLPEETIFYSSEIEVISNFDKELDIKY